MEGSDPLLKFRIKMAKRNTFGVEAPQEKKVSDKEKQWLDEEIEVEFNNLEEAGMMVKFPFGTTKNFKNYTLIPGGKYRLPRRVVKHLEENCRTPMYKWQPDGKGIMAKTLVGYKSRFQCRQVFA